MKTIFIKPAPGRLIRDPDTMRPLAQEGEEKPFTPCRSAGDSHGVIKLNLNQRYTAVITDPVKINHCGFSLSDAGWATGFSVAVVASADTAGASSAAFSA